MTEQREVLHLDITIGIDSDETLRKGALQVVSKLRPDWEQEKIKWKIFTDGITNKLIGGWYEDNKEDTLLVRVYGIGTDLIIDRKAEKENMLLMESMGCGSKLYAAFNNGICYEFISGECLRQDELENKEIYYKISEMMAKMHAIKMEESESFLWKRMNHFADCLTDKFEDVKKQERYVKEYLTKAQLKAEIQELESKLGGGKCPVVFCHYDLLLNNIVINGGRVNFIDLEYGAAAHSAFDIANHFCEFVGCDGGELDFAKWYPSKEFQLDWIKNYLTAYYNFTAQNAAVTDQRVEDLYELVQKFTLCAHLFWSMWAIIQAFNSNIDFDFMDYGIQRLREYKNRKALVWRN